MKLKNILKLLTETEIKQKLIEAHDKIKIKAKSKY